MPPNTTEKNMDLNELADRVLEVVRACQGAGDDLDSRIWNSACDEVVREITRAWPRITKEHRQ